MAGHDIGVTNPDPSTSTTGVAAVGEVVPQAANDPRASATVEHATRLCATETGIGDKRKL